MKLNLRKIIEVPGGRIPFSCVLSADGLDHPAIESYDGPLVAEGAVVNTAGTLTIEGTIRAKFRCICDRCGTPFDREKTVTVNAGIAVDESEEDLFQMEEDEIDLDEILYTCFVLDMDAKVLCRPDCKGLCAGCGANLNEEECTCKKEIDPRWAVLEQLLDKTEN